MNNEFKDILYKEIKDLNNNEKIEIPFIKGTGIYIILSNYCTDDNSCINVNDSLCGGIIGVGIGY